METIPITKETDLALSGSIKKWLHIVSDFEHDMQPDENGIEDCPLCQLFHPYGGGRHDQLSTGCKTCPIKLDTGENFCTNTPYDEWTNDHCSSDYEYIAKDMLNYLENLQARTEIQNEELTSPA